jgi:hypothetical protein
MAAMLRLLAVRPREAKAEKMLAVYLWGNAKSDRTNCKSNFDEDEGQLDPERGAQDAVLAEVDTQTLVFSASEDGRDDVSNTVEFVSYDRNEVVC